MNINALVKDFFVENEFDLVSERVAVIRDDGTVVYANSANRAEAANIGALTSGIWQAAQSLSSLVNSELEPEAYRLSFDTSSDGVYLLPLSFDAFTGHLCCLFRDNINPGKLKQNMRNIAFLLQAYIREELIRAPRSKAVEKSGYLFTDITDEEMDRLFGVAGI